MTATRSCRGGAAWAGAEAVARRREHPAAARVRAASGAIRRIRRNALSAGDAGAGNGVRAQAQYKSLLSVTLSLNGKWKTSIPVYPAAQDYSAGSGMTFNVRTGENTTHRKASTPPAAEIAIAGRRDRKSTRLNSSHVAISYAVFCLKKKTSL